MTHRVSRHAIAACVAAAIAAASLVIVVRFPRIASSTAGATPLSDRPQESPEPANDFEPSDGRYGVLLRSSSGTRLTLSDSLHLLMLFGPKAELPNSRNHRALKLLDVVTNCAVGDAVLLGRYFRATKHGIRCTGPSGLGEAHPDQCLATLALLGLPLSREIVIDNRTYHIADLLNDSTHVFYLQNEQLSWTLVAYAHYMHGTANWTNAFGQTYSIDNLVAELMSRSLSSEPCGGAHRLVGLSSVLASVRRGQINCKESTVESISAYLRMAYDAVAASQLSSGAIDDAWSSRLDRDHRHDPPSIPKASIIVTGHLAGWLCSLSSDIADARALRLRMCRWLKNQLNSATPEQILADVCPYTHAILAARWIDRRDGVGEPMTSAH
jgi:hypothetical protein